MIEGNFHRLVCTKAVGSSGNHTDFVVEALNGAASRSALPNVISFTLPYSKAAGEYSTDYIDQDEGVIPDLPSFNPDIYVATWSTDYFAGFDPVMAAMLARFTGAPPPPSGAAITVNGASFRADQGVAPGSVAAVFSSFSATPDQVLVNGAPATIINASPSQVDFVIPASDSPGLATFSVRAAGQE